MHDFQKDVLYQSENYIANPKVTTMTPLYNGEEFVQGLLDSFEQQTIFDEIEIIIVDSNSSDNSHSLILDFLRRHNNVSYIKTSFRENVCEAMNRILSIARGEYIACAMVDDRHRPDALEKMVAVLDNHPDIALVYANSYYSNVKNDTFTATKATEVRLWPKDAHLHMRKQCCVGQHPMYRRALHEKYGLYSPDLACVADWDFYLRFCQTERFYKIDDVLSIYFNNPKGTENSNPLTPLHQQKVIEKYHLNVGEFSISPLVTWDKKSTAISVKIVFSIIITTFNRPWMLLETLASIGMQNGNDYEVIVINDAGEDVGAVIAWFKKDFPLTYVNLSNNCGPAYARNFATKMARGDWIIYIDDDDLMLEGHLSAFRQAINQQYPEQLFYTDANLIYEEIKGKKRIPKVALDARKGNEFSKVRLYVESYIPVGAFCFQKELFVKTNGFDEQLNSHEDWEFLLQLAQLTKFKRLPVTTVEIRSKHHSKNSRTELQRANFYDDFKEIYRRFDNLPDAFITVMRDQALMQLQTHNSQGFVVTFDNKKEYERWLSNHSPETVDVQCLAERMLLKWINRPKFHLIVPIYSNVELTYLHSTIASLSNQLYKEWALTVVSMYDPIHSSFLQLDYLNWIKLATEDINSLLQGVNQAALELAAGDWVFILPAGTRLEPQALAYFADYINLKNSWSLIYSDHALCLIDDSKMNPCFKPEFNPDFLRSTNYIGSAACIKLSLLKQLGGIEFLMSVEWHDLILKVFDLLGEKAIGHLSEPLINLPFESHSTDLVEFYAKQALEHHFERCGLNVSVNAGFLAKTFRNEYHYQTNPLVSIIIPNKDRLELLEPCLSTLIEKTTYKNYEIIIADNQTSDPDVLTYYQQITTQYNFVKIVSYDKSFNFSAQCNLAAQAAQGEYLLLLNNDTEIVQAEWLSRLLEHAQRPEVGAVGCRLIYPETSKIQHAGVVLGMPDVDGVADHPFIGFDFKEPGYMNRIQVVQNYSAVTAACMMIRTSLYHELGGMDEHNLQVLFNDVDLCLRVGAQGYKVVYTPFATVAHHGNVSIKGGIVNFQAQLAGVVRAEKEREYMRRQWGSLIANDPAYNKHLSLLGNAVNVECHVLANWDTNFHDRPRILGLPLTGGSGDYRLILPFHALRNAALAHAEYIRIDNGLVRMLTTAELRRLAPDSLVMQNVLAYDHINLMKTYREHMPDLLQVTLLDDLLSGIPEKSSVYKTFKRNFNDCKPRMRQALKYSDRLVVTTQPLYDFCRDMIEDVVVIPNALPRESWESLTSLKGQGKKPRVGWVGAQQHQGDLEMIAEVVKALADEVEWVFMGMWLPEFEPYIKETHGWVNFAEYPEKLASLNLDLAIAPLEVNAFNEAKSNLRLLEYGVLGLPVVCTDIYPYQTNDAPVKRVPNTKEAWIEAIRERIHAPDAMAQEGKVLQAWVKQHYFLEHHLDTWYRAFVR